MKDFTLSLYQQLIDILKSKEYHILPNSISPDLSHKSIILRHDIDAQPSKALSMAILENRTGIRSSFFFKTRPEAFIPSIVQQIASLGHEIGYHYEDLVRNHGNHANAISDFERNLDALRKVFPVTTICADGNPLSRYNNLWLWEKYDYKRFGITCEMYLDIDYNEYAYFTDTGRCWNGDKYNVWDHVKTSKQWPRYRTTADIIKSIENDTFPTKAAINIHPQRWNDNPWAWTKELLLQNMKNVVKQGLLAIKYGNPTRRV
ncbi:MAG: hypothetical protein NTW16_05560 [Bacteroidetes bacterium]|nr:hypothetical protein [Bacteroidota bacterium]